MTDGWVKTLQNYLTDRGVCFSPNLVKNVIALGFKGAISYYKKHFPLKETEEEIVSDFTAALRSRYEAEMREIAEEYVYSLVELL